MLALSFEFLLPFKGLDADVGQAEAKNYIDKRLKELSEDESEDEKRYSVVLHNDPVNSIEFVVKVIKSVFGYGMSKATWLMLKAHFSGRSILWVGNKKIALDKKAKMIAYGPDPNPTLTREKSRHPLTVSVESVN